MREEPRTRVSDETLALSRRFLEFLADVRRLSPHTVRAYETDLRAFFMWCALEGVDPRDLSHRRLRGYVSYMVRSGYADKTINRRLSSLRTFYAWMEREGATQTDVAAALPGRKSPKTLPVAIPDEDVTRILQACDEGTPDGFRDRTMVELLYATGARISEAAGLAVADVDFARGQVRLFGKGSKERLVPVYDAALGTARTYLLEHRPQLIARRKGEGSSNAFFISARGNDMTAAALRARFERLVSLAGIDQHVTPHAMRHTFATELLSGGANLKAVQELLGHESLATTQIYTHLSIDRLKAVTSQAHPRG